MEQILANREGTAPTPKVKHTVLVTGGGGNIGRRLVKMLVEDPHGYEVRVFDLKNSKNEAFFAQMPQVKVFYGDISRPEDTVEVSKGVHTVLHLAAVIPPLAYDRPDLVEKVNIEGTLNLLRNVKTHSPKAFFCMASSVATYGDRVKNPYIRVGDPLNYAEGDNYGASKVRMEQMVQNSGLSWSIFRLSAIFGVGNHSISPIMFLVPLETSMEITTLDDTARAFAHTPAHRAELEGHIFNLGGGEACRTTYKDFLSKQFELMGLGGMELPKYTFATRNYHCGYYADGDDLENILHFRRETLEGLYKEIDRDTPKWKRFLLRLIKPLVRRILISQSDPYKAWKRKDREKVRKYFGVNLP